MKEEYFTIIEEIKKNRKNRKLQKCFEDRKKCWPKYIISEKDYFEQELWDKKVTKKVLKITSWSSR